MNNMGDVAPAIPTMSFSDERPGTPPLMDEDDKPFEKNAQAPPADNVTSSSQQTTSTPHLYLDDVDRMLCHEDFGSLLALAVRVKEAREAIANIDGSVEPRRTASEMDPNQVINAVTRMQQQHVLRNYQDAEIPVIRRGTYHMTDSLLNENFHILQQEMERCTNWIAAANEHKKAVVAPNATKKSKSEGGEAIAVKYAKWQTDILMEWMLEHIEHPFPDANQLKELCQVTGLSHAQVVNWTTNMRKRSLKATVENGKKPHHFLDFAFLAQDREKQHKERKAQAQEPQQSKPTSNRKGASSNRAKKKAPYAGMIQQHGGPYTTVIHSSPHHHGYQQGPPLSSHFRPHPSNAYYPLHPQTMMHPQGGVYSHYPAMGQQDQHHALPYPYPTPVYSYVHHQPPHALPQKMAQQYEEREDVEHLDDWDMKVMAVSESFDGSGLEEFAFSEHGDPLLTFANYWGGDAHGDTRDDVHEHDDMMDREADLDSLDMDAFIEGMEHGQMAMHDPHGNEDPLSLEGHGNCDYDTNGMSSETGHQEVAKEEPFQALEESSGTDTTAFRPQRRTSSFSVDMNDLEEDLNGDSDLDMADFLVEV